MKYLLILKAVFSCFLAVQFVEMFKRPKYVEHLELDCTFYSYIALVTIVLNK